MSRTMKTVLVIGALAVPLLIAIPAQVRPEHLDRGQEWLSWSPAERTTFVDGFVAGFSNGAHTACNSADELFEVGKPHHLEDQPSARCDAHLQTYSKYRYVNSTPDFSAYTAVITDFYTKHPEYRNIPFVYLMSLLSDSQYKTAEQLYQTALKGQIRTNF